MKDHHGTHPSIIIPEIQAYHHIPTGDMPGDKVQINEGHVAKANVLFPELMGQLQPLLKQQLHHKAVISVHGGSGVGKSEIGSLLSYYLRANGIATYLLSGDNYPHRIPMYNDAERVRIFRNGGLKSLVKQGYVEPLIMSSLKALQKADQDAAPSQVTRFSWLATYQEGGRKALADYLGSKAEQDFELLNQIIHDFKTGASEIDLKRMGRTQEDLWFEAIDMSQVEVLIIEWTHGNNQHLLGVDLPILLNSTPEETMAHRKERNRDGGVDSPFTTMVLEIEQDLLHSQADRAAFIVTKQGELVDYEGYCQLMEAGK